MNITQKFVTQNPCYTAGRKITVKGLMLHSIGTPQPSADALYRVFNQGSQNACVHGFIDALTGDVIQALPWEHRAWHCGGSGNNTHIGVEMCEPPYIQYVGGASFTVSDREQACACIARTYRSAVELFAYLCKLFSLDPLQDGVIVSHREGCARGIASNHADPEHLWTVLDMGYTMDTFRNDVFLAMQKEADDPRQVFRFGNVNASVLNIRQAPSTDAAITGTHQRGDLVFVTERTPNGWYRISSENTEDGFAASEYITLIPEVPGYPVDNTAEEWALPYLRRALHHGLIHGDKIGNLSLHTTCTRQDLLVFLYRLYQRNIAI